MVLQSQKWKKGSDTGNMTVPNRDPNCSQNTIMIRCHLCYMLIFFF